MNRLGTEISPWTTKYFFVILLAIIAEILSPRLWQLIEVVVILSI